MYFESANIFSYEEKFRLTNINKETSSSRFLVEFLRARSEITFPNTFERIKRNEI